MTKDEATLLYDNGFWMTMTHEDRALFQTHMEHLCMPARVFHTALTITLGRPIHARDFALPNRLRTEVLAGRPQLTEDELLTLIPDHIRLLLLKEF